MVDRFLKKCILAQSSLDPFLLASKGKSLGVWCTRGSMRSKNTEQRLGDFSVRSRTENAVDLVGCEASAATAKQQVKRHSFVPVTLSSKKLCTSFTLKFATFWGGGIVCSMTA